MACLVALALLAPLAAQEALEPLDCRVLLEGLVLLDSLAQQDLKVSKVILDLLDVLDLQEQLGQLELLVPQEHVVLREPRVLLVGLAEPEQQVSLEQQEEQVQLEALA
jgi:hypothetical protein